MVILGVAGAYLAVPVEGEAYVVELLAIACYVGNGCHLGVLSCLYGILLGRESVGVVAHGVEHVVAVLTLVARVDVAGYVAQGVAHMESRTGRVGEHVEHIELLLCGVLGDVVGLVLHPLALPLLLDFSEIVFHCRIFIFVFFRFTMHGVRLWKLKIKIIGKFFASLFQKKPLLDFQVFAIICKVTKFAS